MNKFNLASLILSCITFNQALSTDLPSFKSFKVTMSDVAGINNYREPAASYQGLGAICSSLVVGAATIFSATWSVPTAATATALSYLLARVHDKRIEKIAKFRGQVYSSTIFGSDKNCRSAFREGFCFGLAGNGLFALPYAVSQSEAAKVVVSLGIPVVAAAGAIAILNDQQNPTITTERYNQCCHEVVSQQYDSDSKKFRPFRFSSSTCGTGHLELSKGQKLNSVNSNFRSKIIMEVINS